MFSVGPVCSVSSVCTVAPIGPIEAGVTLTREGGRICFGCGQETVIVLVETGDDSVTAFWAVQTRWLLSDVDEAGRAVDSGATGEPRSTALISGVAIFSSISSQMPAVDQ